MPRYINVDALWKSVTGNIDDCADFLEIIERQPTVTINDIADEIKVTDCNHNADVSKKVSSSRPHENDLINREDALSCFHDWIDSHGDVHTADEMPEYQRIEQLPSAQPDISEYSDKLWRNAYERGKRDAQPKTGTWIHCGWAIACSECNYDMPWAVRNYCPSCGAKMKDEGR